jgi:hypothetical protein
LRQQNRSDKYAQNELYDFKIQNTIQYIATECSLLFKIVKTFIGRIK